MKIIFAASPAIALPSLNALFALSAQDRRFEICAVLTNPDSVKGRGKGAAAPTEIGAAASTCPVKICKPAALDGAFHAEIAPLKPDLLVSFAYGKFFSESFLSLFTLGGINVHPSLLPRWRGASPIQEAILRRDKKTGVSIQFLSPKMDAGGVILRQEIPLNLNETTLSLSKTVSEVSAPLLIRAVKMLAEGDVKAEAQNEAEASYCSLITKEDALINWNESAEIIDAKVRAYMPSPLCRTLHEGKTLYIIEGEVMPEDSSVSSNAGAENGRVPGRVLTPDKKRGILIQTGRGIYCAKVLQYEAKKALGYKDFLNGARGFSGAVLG